MQAEGLVTRFREFFQTSKKIQIFSISEADEEVNKYKWLLLLKGKVVPMLN
jgi:hypothetical protein